MKTSHVLIKLCILTLAFTSLLTTTQVSAQPCGGATPCGTPPDCYAAPKVSCANGAQLEHIITNYCSASTGSLCDPGLFVCMSTTLPMGWTSCSTDCSGANNCIYINIRNLIDCGDATYPKIKKVELRLNKHSGSTKSYVCAAKSQWTTSWSVPNGACTDWVGTTREVTTEASSSSDYVPLLGHYQAVVCGASSVDLKITYQTSTTQTHTTPWLTGITVNTSACPEYGDDHGWCQ